MPIRRSPCELFIKSLIYRGHDNELIREKVRGHNLDYIGAPYVDRLRAAVSPPRPFYPSNRNHSTSQRFLIAEGIRPLFHPTNMMKEARLLLKAPKAKEIVESSLITHLEEEWIAALLRREGVHVSAEAVKLYKKYYFNVDLLDYTEIRALIDARAWVDNSDDPDEVALSRSLAAAQKMDTRRQAARGAISPLSGILHQMRFGIIPGSIELAKLASAARTAATIQVLDSALAGQAERSRDFAIVAKTMTEMLETVGSPEEELQASLRQLALRTDQSSVPFIGQLTAGQHTVDLQPTVERQCNAKNSNSQ